MKELTMKKIKIMAICTSLIFGFNSLNAEEKKPYENGTIITFNNFINKYYEKENLEKLFATCNENEIKKYIILDYCKKELSDSLKTKNQSSKECQAEDKKLRGVIIINNANTINPNQKDENEMFNFFIKSTEDYLKVLHCK